uniref:long-chain-fatty-acid--CoA ligase n=1 Tax=Amphimedon queenslandica TaxID=400682 RepID=A0A1X7T7M9_AMPQE
MATASVVPSGKWTVKPEGEIQIQGGSSEDDPAPVTILDTLNDIVSQHGAKPALKVKRGGEWKTWKYTQYHADVQRVAKSCIAIGLEPHHGVSIIGFNSPEWAMTFMGTIMAGGIAAGVYTTNNKETCQHIATNSRSQIIVCENKTQLNKILQIKDNLPLLKKIVKYLPETEEPLDTEMREKGVITWEEFMEEGKDVKDDVLSDRVSAIKPGHCATLVYTSGTTGPPKGSTQINAYH